MISGLTKAWIGTKNSGTKEVSFSGHAHSGYALSNHTHTASQITDLSSSNIVYYNYTISTYSSKSFSISISFTPKMLLMYYGTSGSNYSCQVFFASRYSASQTTFTITAAQVTYDSISSGISVSVRFGNNYVDISNITSNGDFDCLVFG